MQVTRHVSRSRALGCSARPFRRSVMVASPADKRAYVHGLGLDPPRRQLQALAVHRSVHALLPRDRVEHDALASSAMKKAAHIDARDVDRLLAYGSPPGRARTTAPRKWKSRALRRWHPSRSTGSSRCARPPTLLASRGALRTRHWPWTRSNSVSRRQGRPTFFQVRHPRVPTVVAYTHVPTEGLAIEYRLPGDHPTYGEPNATSNFYGISLRVRVTNR